jgi:acyl-coenzyme A synthetase/AMP-(fatty) acid ligase
MILRTIADFAAARPAHAAMIWGGQAISYESFHRQIQAARARLMATRPPEAGVALILIENRALAWPWVLALRSLGQMTISAPLALVPHLNLGPITTVVSRKPLSAAERTTLPLHPQALVIDGDAVRDVLTGDGAGVPVGEAIAGHLLLSSGATGTPKKMLFDSAAEAAVIALDSTETAYTPHTVFHVGAFPMFTSIGYRVPLRVWTRGGTVVIEQGDDPWAPLLTGAVTHTLLTPGMLRVLLERRNGRATRNDGLHVGITGGPTPWPLAEAAREHISDHLTALYGATEVGGLSQTALRTREDTRAYGITPSRTVQIVDEAGQVKPQGEVGLVRADTREGVSEYWRDPAATRAFFRDGWFYPGDLGRLLEDGRLELMGRANEVMVIAGDKVHPARIERLIQDEIPLSGVCVFASREGDDREIMHVVVEAPDDLSADQIAWIEQNATRMAPVQVHRLETMPRNAMQKIMRDGVRAAVMGPAA